MDFLAKRWDFHFSKKICKRCFEKKFRMEKLKAGFHLSWRKTKIDKKIKKESVNPTYCKSLIESMRYLLYEMNIKNRLRQKKIHGAKQFLELWLLTCHYVNWHTCCPRKCSNLIYFVSFYIFVFQEDSITWCFPEINVWSKPKAKAFSLIAMLL